MCSCYQNSVNTCARGCSGGWWNGSAMVAQGATAISGCNGLQRYITFPVNGTAYVPVSAIRFVPNSLFGNTSNTNATGCLNAANNANGTSGGNCCGFGRCGSNAAITNFYEDYYARQYGLND